ncbi:MAG: MBL fold metallo-hydrolase RNA specificity domain-containing protein, partial [Flexibacteraceae bacterium]
TIGRELLDGAKILKFNNLELPVAADIRRTDIFSGHGDLDDLVQFVQQQKPEKVKKVFLVHGDLPSMVSFQATLQMIGYQNVETPAKGEMFEL